MAGSTGNYLKLQQEETRIDGEIRWCLSSIDVTRFFVGGRSASSLLVRAIKAII